MVFRIFSLDQKVETVDYTIGFLRHSLGREAPTLETLRAVASDLRGRQVLPRSQTLGDLDRALVQLQQSKTARGYDAAKMIAVANVVVRRWPTISQAIEQFGEETAE